MLWIISLFEDARSTEILAAGNVHVASAAYKRVDSLYCGLPHKVYQREELSADISGAIKVLCALAELVYSLSVRHALPGQMRLNAGNTF